ncbi:MAG: hypothetical protein BVN33_08915 [Proteobacteria bacterium ST_bin13]|nr:hypothetical protein [Sphingomonas sp.]OQW74131.1 MAG: hypothetical protein BVN33_08915 [Proteobacteria bacterium ST_bin13]
MVSRRELIGRMSVIALAATATDARGQTARRSASAGSALLSADVPGIQLPAGKHSVAANITVRADVMAMPGATIEIAAGKTLTLLGDFQAPVAPIFTGPGRVDMNASRAVAAYPEWWGAVRDNSAHDCLPALRACVAAHPVTLLGAADYFISDTWKIETSHRRIWGAGKNWGGPHQGTRIIVVSGDRDVVQLGFDTPPASVNDYLNSVDFRWMELTRSAPPKASADDGAAGLRMRFTLDCLVEAISADEHAIGYSVTGAVYTHLRDCHAFRSSPGDKSGPQRFWAFHLDGRTPAAFPGGNASLYITDCGASIGGTPGVPQSIGAYVQGSFADTYIQNFETSQIATGIKLDGKTGKPSIDQGRAGQANFHLLMPILDGYSAVGIELTNISPYAAIDIVDPYCGPAPGAFAGIFIHQARGLVTISGGQLHGWYDTVNGGNALGIFAQNAEGIGIIGTKVIGFRRPISFEQCRDFTIDAAINNPGERAAQPAISLLGCAHGQLRARIKGQAGAFPAGIDLRGGNHHLSIDAAGIDPACLGTGVAGRIIGRGDNIGLAPATIAISGLSG